MEAVELRRMLAAANLTQEELADILEKDRRTVSRWALGERPITKVAAIAIKAVVRHKIKGCLHPESCILALLSWLASWRILTRALYQYGDLNNSSIGIIYHWITQ